MVSDSLSRVIMFTMTTGLLQSVMKKISIAMATVKLDTWLTFVA